LTPADGEIEASFEVACSIYRIIHCLYNSWSFPSGSSKLKTSFWAMAREG
jgi:hypothetical protein